MSEETKRAFRLRVEPLAGDALRLTLWQQPPASTGPGRAGAYRRLAALEGTPLVVALDQVLERLRGEGYRGFRGGERPWPAVNIPARGTGQVRTRTQRAGGRASENGARELPLGEATGVRLGLLFLALRPLRRVERMERVAAGVRSMTDEEAYYWFSKCVARDSGRRARRALRLLLAEE